MVAIKLTWFSFEATTRANKTTEEILDGFVVLLGF
tara:strand:- start:3585 stop:3689 length:105 start_codon:yes stop_codon:yes gene_type:complete